MYLKRLEIYGFKSFASKCVLDFEHNNSKTNITAVVGPNGSGKSNVADAIRWVTGEQSTKLLRSKKNEDVIFGGSVSKQKGSFAEITMVLTDNKPFLVEVNNKKHELNEIEVGRKLYRSGESEYLINNKKVRLIDLQQLLASLGFGQSSYAVIGQGMVDRLLFFNAAERKVLFDEAAGVKQYEIKREQAIRKLDSTESNLTRLKDILTELEPRVVNLRRLVKRAEGRVEIERDLAEIQNKYYGSVLFEYNTKIAQLDSEKAELNKKVVQYNESINKLNIEIEKSRSTNFDDEASKTIDEELARVTTERDGLLQEVAFIEARINQKEQKVIDAIKEKENLSVEKATLTEKIAFLAEKIKDGKNGIIELEKDKNGADSKLHLLKNDKSKLDQKLANISTEINTKEVEAVKTKLVQAESNRVEITNKIYATRNEVSNFENEKRRQESKRNNLSEELVRVNHELARLMGIVSDKEESKDSLLKESGLIQGKIEACLQKFAKAEKELTESFEFKKEEILEFEKEIADAVLDLAKIKSQKDAGLLEKFWGKIERILGRAQKLTNSLNQEKRTDFENKLNELREENRILSTDQSRLKLEISKLENEITYLDQNKKSLDQRKSSLEAEIKELVILKEGDFAKQIEALEKNLVTANSEIQELNSKIQDSSKSLAEKQHKILSEKNLIQEKEAEINRELYELEIEISKKRSLLENQEREISSAKNRLTDIENRILNTKIEQNEETATSELKSKKALLDEKNTYLAKLRAKFSEAVAASREESLLALAKEREKNSFELEISSLKDKINEIELEKAKFETRQEDVQSEIRIAGLKFGESSEKMTLAQGEKDVLRAKIENLKRRLETIGSVDPETVTEFEELESRSSEMTTQVEDLTKAKADLGKVIKQLDETIKTQFNSTFDHIAKEFNRYFEILFAGGKANLSLGEDEEGNYGIEIFANPPGKRVNSLNALSGGERTLTSLALLFAILSINPSPFCVLDEVDAALDESNTVRFAEILNTLSQKTQFIVISHNRNTMKVADTLYGVTMDNDHVSKLISVRLSEALETAK